MIETINWNELQKSKNFNNAYYVACKICMKKYMFFEKQIIKGNNHCMDCFTKSLEYAFDKNK